MRLTVAELKGQSETSFAIISDARSSLADVQELRDKVAGSIQSKGTLTGDIMCLIHSIL